MQLLFCYAYEQFGHTVFFCTVYKISVLLYAAVFKLCALMSDSIHKK